MNPNFEDFLEKTPNGPGIFPKIHPNLGSQMSLKVKKSNNLECGSPLAMMMILLKLLPCRDVSSSS